jgi:ribosomal-protein-alanine N-acetyltransferase
MDLGNFSSVASKRLLVRPVRESDLRDVLEVNSDPEVTRFLPYATWRSREDGAAWLARMEKLAMTGTGRQFVLEQKESGKVVGTLLLFRFEAASQRAEIGYVLARSVWGQGLMEEALRAVCAYSFSTFGMRRLEAEVDPSNAASHALLHRLGFVKEGLLRKRWVAKGRAYDTNIYGLLAED